MRRACRCAGRGGLMVTEPLLGSLCAAGVQHRGLICCIVSTHQLPRPASPPTSPAADPQSFAMPPFPFRRFCWCGKWPWSCRSRRWTTASRWGQVAGGGCMPFCVLFIVPGHTCIMPVACRGNSIKSPLLAGSGSSPCRAPAFVRLRAEGRAPAAAQRHAAPCAWLGVPYTPPLLAPPT